MSTHDPSTSVDALAARLSTPDSIDGTVARIRRGRRLRTATLASAGLMAGVAIAFGGWGVTRLVAPVEPAAPPVEVTDAPLEEQLRDAVEVGDHRLMEVLIGAGAYVDQLYPDTRGELPRGPGSLNLGAIAGLACDTDAVRILDAAGADRSPSLIFEEDAAVLGTIAGGCDIAALDAVLAGSDGGMTRKDIAKATADTGGLELMAELVERGYPLENPQTGWSTLEDAASEGRTDMVLLLLDLGADPTIWHRGVPLTRWLNEIRAPAAAVDAVTAAAEAWEATP